MELLFDIVSSARRHALHVSPLPLLLLHPAPFCLLSPIRCVRHITFGYLTCRMRPSLTPNAGKSLAGHLCLCHACIRRIEENPCLPVTLAVDQRRYWTLPLHLLWAPNLCAFCSAPREQQPLIHERYGCVRRNLPFMTICKAAFKRQVPCTPYSSTSSSPAELPATYPMEYPTLPAPVSAPVHAPGSASQKA
jgi:hypothetical protein